MAKHKYVKANDPSVFTYFTDASIAKFDPARRGWVPEKTSQHERPADVINFMEEGKGCAGECNPVEVEVEKTFTDCSTIPTTKLADFIKDLSDDDVLNIVKTDERSTARKIAEKEIKSRE